MSGFFIIAAIALVLLVPLLVLALVKYIFKGSGVVGWLCFIAALIMGAAESVAAVTMTSYISPIVFYLILFLTLIIRPQGLLGKTVRKG